MQPRKKQRQNNEFIIMHFLHVADIARIMVRVGQSTIWKFCKIFFKMQTPANMNGPTNIPQLLADAALLARASNRRKYITSGPAKGKWHCRLSKTIDVAFDGNPDSSTDEDTECYVISIRLKSFYTFYVDLDGCSTENPVADLAYIAERFFSDLDAQFEHYSGTIKELASEISSELSEALKIFGKEKTAKIVHETNNCKTITMEPLMKISIIFDENASNAHELNYEDVYTLASSIQDNDTSTEIFARLAKHPSSAVRECIAGKDHLDDETVRILASDTETCVLRSLIGSQKARENLTTDDLKGFVEKDVEIAESVARNVESYDGANTDELADILLKHRDPRVRCGLAENSGTPKKYLKILTKDNDPKIRAAAKSTLE
jgi:hypothetical protein